MTTDMLLATTPSPDLALGRVGRRAARAAAGLTAAGAVTLGVFFAVGEPWGTLNDALSIALAGATLPLAIGLARRNPRSTLLVVGAGLDVVGVVVTSTATAALIARRVTFEGSLPFVLGGQGLIGCWLLLVGLAAWSVPGARRLAAFGLAGGAGLVLTAAGFATGGFESPIASGGFVAALVGTLGFYLVMGRRPRR